MIWSYSIIKKYTATSHFKLIKQLKNEIKLEKKDFTK